MKLFVLSVLAGSALIAADLKPKDLTPKVTAAEPNYDARTIPYHLGKAVPVNLQIRWTTIILFPPEEKLLDFLCGDKDNWTINSFKGANYVAVHPNSVGLKTNLTVIMESGNPYIFVLHDVSQDVSAHADTQVIVNLEDGSMQSALKGKPKYVPSEEVDVFREEAELAKRERDDAQQALAKSVEDAKRQVRAQAATAVRQHYRFDEKKAVQQPFGVKEMWSDGRFTYIAVNTTEAPALYEIKDKKPSLCNWDLRDGIYWVSHVVDHGYLQMGKKRLEFELDKSS